MKAGDIAGMTHRTGYRMIYTGGKMYSSHRLAWLYMTGEWPTKDIDHINCVKHDNKWANLREATDAQNAMNRPKRVMTSGRLKGITWNKSAKKWQAGIGHNGVYHYLGLFNTQENAHAAYCVAAVARFGEFARAA